MTQLDLINEDRDPFVVTIAIACDPVGDPDSCSATVTVYGRRMQQLAKWSGRFVGTMTEWLPRLAQEAVMGYLYGESSHAVTRAAKAVRHDAVQARQRWLALRGSDEA